MSEERLKTLEAEMEAWRGKNKYLFEKALDEYKLLKSSSKTPEVVSLPKDSHAPQSSKKTNVKKTPGGFSTASKKKTTSLLKKLKKNS